MTYPPQQPGPYGQQNPWGQQQPPQGPYPPQQPPSQTPPWLAGGPGGFPAFEPEPKKSRGGLIAVIIVALLVLGGGGFGLWMLLKDDDKSPSGGGGGGGGGGDDARTVAETYVDELETAVNTQIQDIDLSSLEPVTCADDFERMEREIGDAQDNGETSSNQPGSIEVGMTDFEAGEDKASFTLTQKIDGEEGPGQEMTMAKEEGSWKVCGLYESSEPSEEEPTDEPTDGPASDGEVPNPIPTT